MTSSDDNSYCKPLVGRKIQSVEKQDDSWFFRFAEEISLVTESPWRFLNAAGVIVTSEDHGHQFGLPAPVDAAERVLAGVSGRSVVAASITRPAADLTIDFGDQIQLQFIQMSCGYESWRLNHRDEQIICLGGGEVAHLRRPANSNP